MHIKESYVMKVCTTRFSEATQAVFASLPQEFLRNVPAGAVLLMAKAQRYSATQIAGSVNRAFNLQGDHKLSPVRVGRMCKIDSPKVITELKRLYTLHQAKKTASEIVAIQDSSHRGRQQINTIFCQWPHPYRGIDGPYQNVIPRFMRTGISGAVTAMPARIQSLHPVSEGQPATQEHPHNPPLLDCALNGAGKNNPFVDYVDIVTALYSSIHQQRQIA